MADDDSKGVRGVHEEARAQDHVPEQDSKSQSCRALDRDKRNTEQTRHRRMEQTHGTSSRCPTNSKNQRPVYLLYKSHYIEYFLRMCSCQRRRRRRRQTPAAPAPAQTQARRPWRHPWHRTAPVRAPGWGLRGRDALSLVRQSPLLGRS